MKKKQKKKAWLCACIAAVCVSMISAVHIQGESGKEPLQLADGREELKKLSERTVPEIEEKIRERDLREEQEQTKRENRTPNEKMSDAVLLGDSRAQGFAEYEILDQSRVLAKIGISLSETEPYIEKAIGLNPGKIFLSYGLNDLGADGGDSRKFKEEYRGIIRKLREALPSCEIYVTTILPVQQKALDQNPVLAHIEEFNDAVRALCMEERVTCIEIGDMVSEEFYEPDGEHFSRDFYPLWFERMAEAAEL